MAEPGGWKEPEIAGGSADRDSGRHGSRLFGGARNRSSSASGRLIFGAVLLVLGTLWTLDNLQLVDAGEILRYWPIVLVAFGVARLFGWGMPRTPILGGILTFVGVHMLLREFDVIHFGLSRWWPLVLIAAGASLVWRSLRGPGQSTGDVEQASNFSVVAIMGANTRRVSSQGFQSADLSAVMGGVELDLREARAGSNPVHLDVFAWWGGIEVVVPDDWEVVSEAFPFMGAIEDNTHPTKGPHTTQLIIRGTAIMGGVEIQSASDVRRVRGSDNSEHD